ncbi:exodeoxyribonuclease I [Aquabacterium sp. OR-4]|uniref:exodeoxyribonuclease I n=1 Tax=Aquabacterium sp. OR-4 TaxID=2978127 RepID=UPI0021B3790B|nr:exodeoxyribonuclease I [Aquabacterium sp. OR-4]MDT7835640.1 exodeoxyribonuclease I [Aquabacterium sp. OR-4]
MSDTTRDFTFFWHDYETFGRVPRRDRPAQFAGIRTDAALNEVGPPLELFCQPPHDTLPDPESCLLTGITPQQCAERGVTEQAFAAQIHDALAAPGTVGVGYNTIRFDDEVTRHLFWRNLIDPYGREWQNGCGRWDLLDTVRCAWALRPEGIEWPKHDDGRPSFKLEHLTVANGLAHDSAHDALSDVRATIALARLLRERQPRLWDFCLKLRKKDAVWAEIGLGKPFLHLSGMYGTERGCLALVWPLGVHPTNKNELIVWDLSADPAELPALDVETLRLRMFTRADQLPEGLARLPVKTIHVNKSPVVIGNLKTLPAARAAHWGLDLDTGLQRAAWAQAHAAALAGVPWSQVFARPAPAQAPDVDEDLYGGFIGPGDRRTLERLRGLDGAALAGKHPAFEDGRLDELLFRYRARNWPDTLADAERQRWAAHCSARLHEGLGGVLTVADFMARIDTLGEQAGEDERAQDILGALYDWAEAIAPEMG